MNRINATAWSSALAIAIGIAGGSALAGEVTVIGSRWTGQSAAATGESTYAVPPASDAPAETECCGPTLPCHPFDSSWYARVEYLHFGQRNQGFDQNIDSGLLYTLGYLHRFGPECIRGEVFAGNMHTMADIGGGQNITATTTYAGGRGEYEYLWDVDCDWCPPLTLFAGLGTRIWNANSYDAITSWGQPAIGAAQAWWTIYPYIGAEKHWELSRGGEIYALGRIGCTAVTFTHQSFPEQPAFYMNPGITGQVQCGYRLRHLSLGGYFEAMSWQNSASEHVHGDPTGDLYYWGATQSYSVGMQAAIAY